MCPEGSYLSKRGYVLLKTSISKEELLFLKNELIAKPLQNDKFMFNKTDTTFPIYIETKNKIYIPKMFGIQRYGFPKILMQNYLGINWDRDIPFKGALYESQIEPVKTLIDSCKEKGGGILQAQTGMGKCMGIDTPILMFDGSIKKIQNIKCGDILMGDDSTPRKVLSLARGRDLMYDIISENGEKYTVNKEHILCLKMQKEQKIVQIAVKDYIKLPENIKKKLKGYKTAIDFPSKPLDIDPYILGLWLGNDYNDYKCIQNFGKYTIVDLTNCINKFNLRICKTIPIIYKCNSIENRLQLLAGLIDTSGYLINDHFSIDCTNKKEELVNDIIYLVRSLGLQCSKQLKNHLYIHGNINLIPSMCYKLTKYTKTGINEIDIDILKTNILVKEVGYDDYYGFTIDNNHRYVLGDFTVTHNTFMALNILSELKSKTLIIVNKIPLMRQWESEINQFLPNAEVGFIQGQKKVVVEDKDIVLAMLQSLARIDYPQTLFQDFQCLVLDECHNVSSRVFSQVLNKICCKYTIGLSATPTRSDGCEYIFKYHLGDIVYKSSVKRKGLAPILNILKIDSSDYKEIVISNKVSGQSQIQFTSMLSELVQMPKRNILIIEIIKDLIIKENRKILVLSDRRNHLQTLVNILDNDFNVSFTYGLFLGRMKMSELERSKACQVIFASFSAFGEGVSEKDLDTLILTTPKKFIGHLKNMTKNESGKLEQIVGRIFRKDHTEKHPLIIDFFDNFSIYKSQSAQRKTFYKQHFKDLIIQESSINLDDHKSEDLNVNCIKTKEKKQTNILFDETETENSIDAKLLNSCLIDD